LYFCTSDILEFSDGDEESFKCYLYSKERMPLAETLSALPLVCNLVPAITPFEFHKILQRILSKKIEKQAQVS